LNALIAEAAARTFVGFDVFHTRITEGLRSDFARDVILLLLRRSSMAFHLAVGCDAVVVRVVGRRRGKLGLVDRRFDV